MRLILVLCSTLLVHAAEAGDKASGSKGRLVQRLNYRWKNPSGGTRLKYRFRKYVENGTPNGTARETERYELRNGGRLLGTRHVLERENRYADGWSSRVTKNQRTLTLFGRDVLPLGRSAKGGDLAQFGGGLRITKKIGQIFTSRVPDEAQNWVAPEK